MIIIGRRLAQRAIAGGNDEVLANYPLPAGCSLKDIWMDWSLIATTEITVLQAGMYGISGFIVPSLDPDTAVTVNAMWDQQVPKDAPNSAGAFDLDTDAVDTTPEFEVGEPDWTGVFGVAGNTPLQIFRRRRLVTFPKQMGAYQLAAGTDLWLPVDTFNTHIKRNVTAQRHSMILFGVSSPLLDVTTVNQKSSLLEVEWSMMTYIETFLEQAIINLIGLTETGAESPYEESAAFVADLIEATVLEETAGAFVAQSWVAYCNATFKVDVPGTFSVGVLTSEG